MFLWSLFLFGIANYNFCDDYNMKRMKCIGKIIQGWEVKMLNYSFYYIHNIEFRHVMMLSLLFELKQCVIFA